MDVIVAFGRQTISGPECHRVEYVIVGLADNARNCSTFLILNSFGPTKWSLNSNCNIASFCYYINITSSYGQKSINVTSFWSGWAIVEQLHSSEFTVLRDFCGGIASVFPNTATVESDFSILGWEADEYRRSLTNLSLQGIMQCKQFNLLNSLSNS